MLGIDEGNMYFSGVKFGMSKSLNFMEIDWINRLNK